MDLIIRTEGLTKIYPGDVRAVDGIDFEVKTGEVLGFLGANGAGKTTTIRMLTTPLMFVSGAMMPLQLAPRWLRTAARFKPIDYAVRAVRALVVTGYDWAAILPGVLVLGAFASLGVTLATSAFREVSD